MERSALVNAEHGMERSSINDTIDVRQSASIWKTAAVRSQKPHVVMRVWKNKRRAIASALPLLHRESWQGWGRKRGGKMDWWEWFVLLSGSCFVSRAISDAV
ncbi:MAG: hypothetical protein H8D43_01570 [Chloroflexi bacterium]|nr:hypothetical protein [Chloroflexota bacterium]